jgi:hypothetical protein
VLKEQEQEQEQQEKKKNDNKNKQFFNPSASPWHFISSMEPSTLPSCKLLTSRTTITIRTSISIAVQAAEGSSTG